VGERGYLKKRGKRESPWRLRGNGGGGEKVPPLLSRERGIVLARASNKPLFSGLSVKEDSTGTYQ
jgi:hypothetical protein